ncbi:MAG: hypothetical protein ACP5D1_13000 [Bacteroidales bacterium]
MMKQHASLLLFFFITVLIVTGCRSRSGDTPPHPSDSAMIITKVATEAISLAPSITYDITVKNPDPDDWWTTECLNELKLNKLVDMIFEAVYEGKLTPWHYHEERPMTVKEIRELEKDPEFSRSRIGKVQFIEDWHFNEETLNFQKRVKALMLAYELYDAEGKVRGYKAAFQVFLNP